MAAIVEYIKLRNKGIGIKKAFGLARLQFSSWELDVLIILAVLVMATVGNCWLASYRFEKASQALEIMKSKHLASEAQAKYVNLENVIIGCLNSGYVDINHYTHECRIKKL